MGNLIGKSYHRNCLLWKNGPKWFNLKSFNLLESRLLRGREGSSQSVHALSHFLLFFSLHFLLFSFFLLILFVFLYFLFLSYFYVSCCFFLVLLLVVYCAQLRHFYTVCRDKIYRFAPQLLLTWCGCPYKATHWSVGRSTITTTLCWLRHVPFLDKRVLLYFIALRDIPLWIRVGCFLLLTPIACTKWFKFIFSFFGWYVIIAGHFPQKSLSGNSRIDFALLPIARPYHLLPLTHGPLRMYWLGTSGWCLSLVLLHSHVSPWLVCSSCVYGCLWICLVLLCILLLIFNPLWRGWAIGSSFFTSLFFPWARFCLGMGFSFFNTTPVSFHFWFVGRLILLLCHCIVSAMYYLTVLTGPPLVLPCIA